MSDRRQFLKQLGLAAGAAAALSTAGGEETPAPATEAAGAAPEAAAPEKPRVVLVNGSPHRAGCTYTALSIVAEALEAEGMATEILFLGKGPFYDCTGCGACRRKGGRCVLDKDGVNDFVDKCRDAAGYVFGSPVYYGHPSGRLLSVMDRMFYASGSVFQGKPAAAVASSRRAGSLATLDAIQKHFTINQMPVVSSAYWNEVHGNAPEEVLQDAEGCAIMRQLGHNMARAVRAFANAPAAVQVPRAKTNFIR